MRKLPNAETQKHRKCGDTFEAPSAEYTTPNAKSSSTRKLYVHIRRKVKPRPKEDTDARSVHAKKRQDSGAQKM